MVKYVKIGPTGEGFLLTYFLQVLKQKLVLQQTFLAALCISRIILGSSYNLMVLLDNFSTVRTGLDF